jgi:ubiquinone/menaquinone biosynthesis C-methylase UbiE
MIRRLQKRIHEHRPDAKLLRAPAEDLPFNDDSFDTVVSTLVLCTVDDQPRALREIRRVLRPGGRLLFIEHVRSDDEKLARLQDRMMPINVRIGHGCHCNRSTHEGIHNAGFDISELERDTLRHAPRFIRPLIVGVAEASAGGELDQSTVRAVAGLVS